MQTDPETLEWSAKTFYTAKKLSCFCMFIQP